MGQIYCIRNIVNGKCYVGRTINTFKSRYPGNAWHHRSKNSLIANDAKIYSKDDFEIFILHSSKEYSYRDLFLLETAWVDKLNCMKPNGYNIVPPTEFTPVKSGFRRSGEINCSNGKTYRNALEASIDIGLDSSSGIFKQIEGKWKHAKGLTFSLWPEIPKPYIPQLLVCSNGKTYNTAEEAGNDLNILAGKIRAHLNGKSSHCKKYTFAYHPDKPKSFVDKPLVYCSDGNIYASPGEAARILGIRGKSVWNVLKYGHAMKGYNFSYSGFPTTPPARTTSAKISVMDDLGNIFESQCAAGRHWAIKGSDIGHCLSGKYKQISGRLFYLYKHSNDGIDI